MKLTRHALSAVFAFALAGAATGAMAQAKWDLPSRLPADQLPHRSTWHEFASDVDKATGGKLKITVHPNASLFKAPEIKRAVQDGQAQIGEVLMSTSATNGLPSAPTPCRSWPTATTSAVKLYKGRSRCSKRNSASRA